MTLHNSLALVVLTQLFLLVGGPARAADAPVPVEVRNRWPVGASLLFLATPGEALRKGAVVAVLDPGPLIAEIQRVEGLLNAAQTEEKSLQEQLARLDSFSSDPDNSARKLVKESEEALKRFARDAVIGELSLQQAVTDSAAGYDQELVRYNARDKLLKEGFIQKPEYDMEGSKLQSTKIGADLARAKLDRFLTAEKPQQQAELNQKIEQAKEALKRVDSQNATSKEQLSSRLAEVGKRKAALQNAVASDREQLSGVTFTAPISCAFRIRSEESGPALHARSLIGPGELVGHLHPASQ